jgi:Arc/MetJ-type ribon-helix-helix transcriptional regulator
MMERVLIHMPPDLVDRLESVMEVQLKLYGEPRNMSALVRRALYAYLKSQTAGEKR